MAAPVALRIARNDATLAHAAAHGEIKRLRTGTQKLFDGLGRRNVEKNVAAIRAHFGSLVLLEGIKRLKGSRASAQWLVLDANTHGGGDMQAILINLTPYGWRVDELRLWLAAHMVARLLQRTVGTNDLQRSAEILRAHCMTATRIIARVTAGKMATTATGEGALIWHHHEDGMRGMTWIGVDDMRHPVMRHACEQARERATVGFHIEDLKP